MLFDERSVAAEGVLNSRARHARDQVREREDLHSLCMRFTAVNIITFAMRGGSEINAFHTISFTNMATKSAGYDKILEWIESHSLSQNTRFVKNIHEKL